MSKQRFCLAVAAGCAVLAVVAGAAGYLLARQQGSTPLSDLLLWGFLFALGLAVLLNLLALPIGELRQDEPPAPGSFNELADAYLAYKRVTALPVNGCYRSAAGETLIYRLPPDADPGIGLFGQLCQLKLQYQCQRVEVLSGQPAATMNVLAAWQEDIHFIGYFELNRLKFN